MVQQPDLTTILGQESQPIEFVTGLIGLEEWRQFVLITHPAGEPLRLLQSLDNPRLSLIVGDPRQIISDYQASLTEADIQKLRYEGDPRFLESDEPDMAVYCILSVEEEPFNVTVNLLGPVIINWKTGLALQIVLTDADYSSRYPLTSSLPAHSSSNRLPEKEGE